MKKWQKITLFSVLGLLLGGSIAGGAWASKQAVAHEEAEIAEVAEEEKESWIKTKYETIIVPLFASVSVSSLATMAITIGLTVAKNKKLDEKVLIIEEKATEKYVKAEEKLAEATNILGQVKEIYQITTKSGEQSDHVVEVVDKGLNQVQKIDSIVKIMAIYTQIELEKIKNSPEAVKSGVVEKVNEISALIKGI